MAEDRRNRPDYLSDASASKPARDSAGDPLAELARLIGQSDPFTDVSRRAVRKPLDSMKSDDRPAPEWLARPASSADRDENQYADDRHAAPRDTYDAGGYRADHDDGDYRPHAAGGSGDDRYRHDDRYAQDHAAPEPQAGPYRADHNGAQYQGAADHYHADDRYRVALPNSEYEADTYYADDGHLPPQGEESMAPARRRGGIVTIAAVLGLAVIGTAGAFGYRAFTSHSDTVSSPPIIKADTTPAKTVPPAANADAQSKPFQDRIGVLAAPERVVPREEQPVALATTPPRVTAPQPSAQNAAPMVAPPPTGANEPKRVRTMTIRPDSPDMIATNAAPVAPVPGTQATTGATRSIAPPAKQQQSAPMPLNSQPDPSARSKVATRSPAPAASGAYVVQVSAQKTEAEAQSSYRALQAKYPAVLGNREASIRRADLGDKGVYFRAQIGPFATSEQATTFCQNYRDAGGQCIVQKN